MFAKFEFKLFPIVIVKFSESIENDQDFENFINSWKNLYLLKHKFTFIFDTTDVGFPPIKYCYRMSKFIRELRDESTQYLEKSLIIVRNKNVMRLLNLIFYIQPPVATVLITDDYFEKVYKNINAKNVLNTNINLKNINILNEIKPSYPLLPFL